MQSFRRILLATVFVPVLLGILGFGSCFEDAVLVIEAPTDGQTFNVAQVPFRVAYENADTGTLEILLNDTDVTSLFAIGDSAAEAVIDLSNGDYLLEASIDADGSGGSASDSIDFTVDVPTAPVATSIEIVSGDGQSGAVGTTLADDLVALVLDQFGDPFEGGLVLFAASDGTVVPGNDLSDPDGLVSAALTLPTTPGGVTVDADLDGTTESVTFGATALVGPAANLVIVSGDNQTGYIGEALAEPLVVSLTDQYGNAVAGDDVAFASSDGIVDPAVDATDASGQASTEYTVGATPGTQYVTATAATTLAVVQFTVNADYVPEADSITLTVDPSTVSADDGASTATAEVLDQFGTPLDGLTVAIGSTIGSAGAVNDNGDGTYSASITGLTTVGSGVVTASVGLLSDSKDLTVVAGEPADIALQVPATVDSTVGTATALATLTDAEGNGIAGEAVSIVSDFGSVGGVSDLGDGGYSAGLSGLTTPGTTVNVTASLGGLSDTQQILILGTGEPETLVLSCDDTVNADDGTAACAVVVEDGSGNGVDGLTIGTASGCATPGAVTDNGDGSYDFTVGGLTTAGDCDVTASFDTLSDTETITVTAGATVDADLSCSPDAITADQGQTDCTATFTDANGNAKSGLSVVFSGAGSAGPVTESPAGTYSATISGLTDAPCGPNDLTVNVSGDGASDSATVTVSPGETAAISVSCPTEITAGEPASCDGNTTDQYGNGTWADPSFDSDCGASFSDVAQNDWCTPYRFTVSGLTAAGTCTITATDHGASDSATITIAADITANADLTCETPISADDGTSDCSVAFTDAYGNAKSGLSVAFSGDGSAGSITESPAGTYNATVSGLTTAGDASITATADGVSDAATVVVEPGAPTSASLACDSPVDADDGTSSCSADFADQYGNDTPGETVSPVLRLRRVVRRRLRQRRRQLHVQRQRPAYRGRLHDHGDLRRGVRRRDRHGQRGRDLQRVALRRLADLRRRRHQRRQRVLRRRLGQREGRPLGPVYQHRRRRRGRGHGRPGGHLLRDDQRPDAGRQLQRHRVGRRRRRHPVPRCRGGRGGRHLADLRLADQRGRGRLGVLGVRGRRQRQPGSR